MEFDKIDKKSPGIYRYTAPMLNLVEIDTRKFCRSGTSTLIEGFYEQLNYKCFDPIRDRGDVRELMKNRKD